MCVRVCVFVKYIESGKERVVLSAQVRDVREQKMPANRRDWGWVLRQTFTIVHNDVNIPACLMPPRGRHETVGSPAAVFLGIK